MQKLYKTKYILVGLTAISITLYGMKPAIPKSNRRQRYSASAQQEQDIALFIKLTAVSHQELLPKEQEFEILSFVNDIAQQHQMATATKQKEISQQNRSII